MAGINAGDTLTYSARVTALNESVATMQQIAGCVESMIAGSATGQISNVGSNSFSLWLESAIDRNSLNDLKYDLDSAVARCPGVMTLEGSTLVFHSRATAPVVPGTVPNPNAPSPPPGSSPQFIRDLATRLGVSESNVWLILLGGIGAFVLMVKK